MHRVIPIVQEPPPEPDVHVASLVLQIRPEFRKHIEQHIDSLAECTCYSDKHDGGVVRDNVLVVVMEVAAQGEINRVIATLNELRGVINVNLVYHYCDSAQSMTDEMEVAS